MDPPKADDRPVGEEEQANEFQLAVDVPETEGSPPRTSKPIDLLAAYDNRLELVEGYPPFSLRPLQVRWFLRFFMLRHIAVHVDVLKRRYQARQAIGHDDELQRKALETYQSSLPPLPYKLMSIAFLAAVFLVGNGIASLLVRILPLSGDLAPQEVMSGLTSGLVGLDPGKVADAVTSSRSLAALLLAIGSIGVALAIVLPLPLLSFSTKRKLLAAYPDTALRRPKDDEGQREESTKVAASLHLLVNAYKTAASTSPKSEQDPTVKLQGVYLLEAEVFAGSGVRPLAEFPFDLLLRAMAAVILIVYAVAMLWEAVGNTVTKSRFAGFDSTALVVPAIAALVQLIAFFIALYKRYSERRESALNVYRRMSPRAA